MTREQGSFSRWAPVSLLMQLLEPCWSGQIVKGVDMRLLRWGLLGWLSLMLTSCSSSTSTSRPGGSSSTVEPSTKPSELILGLWELVTTDPTLEGAIEFEKDGKLASALGPFEEPGKYQLTKDGLLDIFFRLDVTRGEQFKVKVNKDELILTHAEKGELRFKRSPLSSPDSIVWKKPRGLIIGEWEGDLTPGTPGIIEFSKLGRVTVKPTGGVHLENAPYKFVDDDVVATRLELSFGRKLGDKWNVKVTKDELVLSLLPENKFVLKLKRKR